MILDNREMDRILKTAEEKGRQVLPMGEVATYIPELGKADGTKLGICIRTKEGQIFQIGDTDTRFTIQSISKIVSLALAIEICGFETVFDKVGMEPSGEAFNSLVELDLNSNKPFNPMINSGALTISSLLHPELTFKQILEFTRKLCMDPDIQLNEAVYQSEMSHISRNRAIAYLLESKNIIKTGVEESLTLYTKMCSLDVTAVSLANLAMVLAAGGTHPETGEQLLRPDTVKVVKTIMLTCGMYDGSGEFAVRVGIPTKSGVGGGLLSVVDGRLGIGVYGPALDAKGNCIAGRPLLEYLSQELKLHIFQ